MTIDIISLLVSGAARAIAIGLVAFLCLGLFRVRSSAARHAIWTVALIGMLLQIPLGLVVPAIALKALPSLPPSIQPKIVDSTRIPAPAVTRSSNTLKEFRQRRIPKSRTLEGIYLAISIFLLIRMAFGYWGVRRMLRTSKPIPKLGPDILESDSVLVPGSVGCFRSRILLPPAWKDWDSVKLRAVLAHERAHIRRRDWLIRFVSQVNVCIFWFHPLAWWLDRELGRLAEEAADDVALSACIENWEDYAATLVDIARAAAVGGRVLNSRVIWMAKDSKVMRRVKRILGQKFPVAKPLGRYAWATLIACGVPVIYLSAAVKLTSGDQNSRIVVRQPLLTEPKSPPKLIAQSAPNRPQVPARPEEAPITMCLLIDVSGSMTGQRAGVTAAALALFKASKPGDEVCMVDFNDEVFYDLPFTSDLKKMEESLDEIDARGGKALRDAIGQSIDHVERAARNKKKVLVVVTEGNDSSSTLTQDQLLDEIRNSGVPIYSIGLLSADPVRATAAKSVLRQLAEASGGSDYYPSNVDEIQSISSKIATDLRTR